jgi:hypothetical protein
VGFGEYLTLAWLGTSLAAVARALGASLEHEETVRDASYGYRHRQRHEEESRDSLAERRCPSHAPGRLGTRPLVR